MRTVQVEATTVRNALAAARRELGLDAVNGAELLRNKCEECPSYRITLASGDVVEANVITGAGRKSVVVHVD